MNSQKTDIVQTQNISLSTVQVPTEKSVPSGNSPIPAISSEKQKKQQKNNNKIYSIIAVILFIMIVGEFGFVFVYHHSLLDILKPSSLSVFTRKQNTNNVGNSNIIVPTPKIADTDASNTTIPVPTGPSSDGTGSAAGFAIQVNKVIKNPTVIGDKPGTNLEYLEFDISVTNNTSATSFTPGVFYFQNAATGKLFMPADMFGSVSYNWIISSFSDKRVTIQDKNPLLTTQIPAGQTVSNLYLIYQILWGEKGQLVWDTTDSLTPIVWGPNSPKFVLFHEPVQLMQGGKLTLFELHATNNENNRVEIFSIP